MTEDKEEKQFLATGDTLQGLLGENFKDKASELITTAVEKGKPSLKAKIHDDLFNFLRYLPDDWKIGVESVIAKKGEENVFLTAYPFFKGIKNKLQVHEILSDGSRLAGFVKVSKADENPMWMFNPFYAHSLDELEKAVHDGKGELNVSALALEIEITPETILKIDKGDMYKVALEDFLKANPDKTKKDFPYVEINATHMSALFPSACIDGFEYASDINAVEKFSFMDMDFYRLEIEVLRDPDEGGMKLNLYANAELLKGAEPKVGDNVRGYLQFYAY